LAILAKTRPNQQVHPVTSPPERSWKNSFINQ
jgi:hypothetical protein